MERGYRGLNQIGIFFDIGQWKKKAGRRSLATRLGSGGAGPPKLIGVNLYFTGICVNSNCQIGPGFGQVGHDNWSRFTF